MSKHEIVVLGNHNTVKKNVFRTEGSLVQNFSRFSLSQENENLLILVFGFHDTPLQQFIAF